MTTGQFELDPNRVLDIILDAFEQQPMNMSYINLIKNFRKENITHIVGFKFAFYGPKDPPKDTPTPTPAPGTAPDSTGKSKNGESPTCNTETSSMDLGRTKTN